MSELTLIILTVTLTGMVCLPLILNHFKQKNKGNLLKERLRKETQADHLKSSDFETWREAYCLGLDQENNRLLFLNLLETDNEVQKIDLSQIRLCKPNRDFREAKEGKEKRQIIKKVSLVLDQFNELNKPFEIELYDEDKSDYMINEWELAQEWSKKINELKK
ncbi:hypothetical protein J2X69_002669 [Algoriphagus sp. 4150]|uniref:hypothetical protein n=1 Tax=Algoriphagus sp. 4150 TaxID=2817756 RepID=UPI002863F701|nr:hypothetical protein [Algoriphagus sp. 4150]MDR7130319.1 hypothetical protein [Algoriphagus sp. 4150]